MSDSRLLARAIYGKSRSSQKTGIIVGVFCAIFAVALMIGICIHGQQRAKRRAQTDPETARAEQRRENGGWWGRELSRETAMERRERAVQEIKASRCWEGGIEREARREREAREGEPAPPMYQLPAPTYPATPETRRQWMMANRQSPSSLAPIDDAPPAYDSPAVWPART